MDFINKCFGSLFKKTYDGKASFHPWGGFGQGYVLPDETRKSKIMQFLKTFSIITVIALVIGILSGLELFIVILVIAAIWYWAHTSSLVKGLSTVSNSSGGSGGQQASSQQHTSAPKKPTPPPHKPAPPPHAPKHDAPKPPPHDDPK